MQAFHTEEKNFHGEIVKIEFFYDNDSRGYPWDEFDGHGEIREVYSYYGRPDKKPGEIVLYSNSRQYWVYDFKGAIEKAKKENWGISGDSSGLTPGQIAEKSVLEDMAYCRKWLTGDLFYVGIVCTVLDKDGGETSDTDSCWGFEYGFYGKDDSYAKEESSRMAENLAETIHNKKKHAWRDALKEARQRRYWACRDIVTIGV